MSDVESEALEYLDGGLPSPDFEVGVRHPSRGRRDSSQPDMLVGGHREARVGVTESFGHDLDRCAGGDQERRVHLSLSVEVDGW